MVESGVSKSGGPPGAVRLSELMFARLGRPPAGPARRIVG